MLIITHDGHSGSGSMSTDLVLASTIDFCAQQIIPPVAHKKMCFRRLSVKRIVFRRDAAGGR